MTIVLTAIKQTSLVKHQNILLNQDLLTKFSENRHLYLTVLYTLTSAVPVSQASEDMLEQGLDFLPGDVPQWDGSFGLNTKFWLQIVAL